MPRYMNAKYAATATIQDAVVTPAECFLVRVIWVSTITITPETVEAKENQNQESVNIAIVFSFS